jgi:hypothetical protein
MPSRLAHGPVAEVRVRKAERDDIGALIDLEHRVFATDRLSRRSNRRGEASRRLRQHRQHRSRAHECPNPGGCFPPRIDMSWQPVLTALTALTMVARFSIPALILIVRVPARPSRVKDISIPSMRRNVCARRSRPAKGAGISWPIAVILTYGLASRATRGSSNSAASARTAPDESATVRERLVAELSAINTADEAAVWAQRNLPVKDTLTAGDAKILEERFQARLSAISEGHAPDGTTSADTLDGVAPHQPPHIVPDENFVSAGKADADTSYKTSPVPEKRSRGGVIALWAKPSGCAIRTTEGLCCGSPVLCAAAYHRIRITSRLPNRVGLDTE